MKLLLVFAAVVFLTAGCAVKPEAAQAEAPAYSGQKVASFAAPHTNGTLYDGSCQNGAVLRAVPPQFRHVMKSATGTYEGKPFGVCWTWNADESAAIVVWDDGGAFAVPRQILKFPIDV